MGRKAIPIEARFWTKATQGSKDECWLWHGSKCGLRGEYGQIFYQGRKDMAHRVVWAMTHGALPPADIEVCHTCDNGLCVNPAHLFLGTHHENMMDKMDKGRNNAPFGSKSGAAKLDEEKVRQIKELIKQGVPQRTIGKQFGVSNPAICAINRGKTWKQVAA